MRSDLSLKQTHILDAKAKPDCYWAFVVTFGATTYRWSTRTLTPAWDGNNYTFRIIDFTPITLNRGGHEAGIQATSDITITITNKGEAIDPTTLVGAKVVIYLVMEANLGYQFPAGASYTMPDYTLISDDEQIDSIISLSFRVVRATPIKQTIKLYCEDWIQGYLKGDFPNTPEIDSIFPSDNARKDNACVPYILGTGYHPLRPVVISGQIYYVLGIDTPTYTITEFSSPAAWPNKSTWTDTTKFDADDMATKTGEDGVDYKVVQPKLRDSDGDGTDDANCFFPQGKELLDFPCKYSRSDTSSITNPANVIENILEAYGTPSDEINATSQAAAATIYTNRNLTFNVSLFYKISRKKLLARLLSECHTELVPRGDGIYFKPLTKAIQLVIEKGLVLPGGFGQPRSLVKDDQKDSLHVAWQQSGKSVDTLVKALVPAKSTTAKPASKTLEMPDVQDSQNVQRAAQLTAQLLLLPELEISISCKERILQLEPGDVIQIRPTDYGGSFNAMINRMTIHRDCHVDLVVVKFSDDLDDWDDLSPDAEVVAEDTTTGGWKQVVSGDDSSGDQNILPGRIRIQPSGDSTKFILFDPSEPVMEFWENNVRRFRLGDIGTDDWGLEILDHGGNSILKLDGAGANLLSGWTIDSDEIKKVTSNAGISINSAIPKIVLTDANAYERVFIGKNGTDYGIIVRDESNNVIIQIDETTKTASGFTLDTTSLKVGTNILLDSAAKAISINDATFGNSGIQLQYNGGTPRAYIGDGSNAYVQYDGTKIQIKAVNFELDASGNITASSVTIKTATSGQRIEILQSDNEIHFYGDRGDTTIEELATIGISQDGADYVVGNFGSANSTRIGIYARSSSSRAILGSSLSDIGVYGTTTSGYGVKGYAVTGYSGYFGFSSLMKAPLAIEPSASADAPTHEADKGSLWVTSAGILYINTDGSTTWAKVGGQ